MGRIKEFDRKNTKKKKRNAVIYIICEGKETEPGYFKAFRTRYCHIDILPLVSADKSANGLVNRTMKTIGENSYFPEDGDVIWCVFDCDYNTDAMLQEAEKVAKEKGYHIAFSNPSFEYWYLLHFTAYYGYLANCDAVIRQLEKPGRMPMYSKSVSVYSDILEYQQEAIQNAKRRMEKLKNDRIDLISRDSNPATNVYELVEYLNEKRED